MADSILEGISTMKVLAILLWIKEGAAGFTWELIPSATRSYLIELKTWS
jgi:hypothetical protein